MCAAGPEPIITTLVCILLSLLLFRRLEAVLLFGLTTGFCCMLAAAAMLNPEDPARNVRLKAEENSLTAFVSLERMGCVCEGGR